MFGDSASKVGLSDGLLRQPKVCNVLKNSDLISQVLKSWQSLPKAFRAIADSESFLLSLQETTSSHSQSQSHSSGVDHFTLLLLNTWLVEVRELRFPQIKILIKHLVVKFQSIICVHQILFCLVSTQLLCEIASTNKGSRIDERSNYYCYACHFIYL